MSWTARWRISKGYRRWTTRKTKFNNFNFLSIRLKLINKSEDDPLFTIIEYLLLTILENFFSMEREKATQIMLKVHTEGSAVVGIYPRDIAETKSEQVNQYAQENSHPLLSVIEMTDWSIKRIKHVK